MTVIRGLSPLVRIKDFRFGKLKVRVVGGALLGISAGPEIHGPGTWSQTLEVYLYTSSDSSPAGKAVRAVFTQTGSVYGWVSTEFGTMDGSSFADPKWHNNYWPYYGIYYISMSFSDYTVKRGSLIYDMLPDVVADLDHLGQRLEVWREVEISGGSREYTRLFRSKPAAQVSIAPLQDAGWVDEDGYIVNLPEQGLPVFGRNAPGSYSQIDTYNSLN